MMRKTCLLVWLIAFSAPFVLAQAQEKKPAEEQPATAPVANPADVSSRNAIMAATYDVISGPAGKKRDWHRFLSLFARGARPASFEKMHAGQLVGHVFSPGDYVKLAEPYFVKEGFF